MRFADLDAIALFHRAQSRIVVGATCARKLHNRLGARLRKRHWRSSKVDSVLLGNAPPTSFRPGAAMNAFLVRVDHFLVFLTDDPRSTGCDYPIEEDVQLEDDTDSASGPMPVGVCVGQDPFDERHFCIFRSEPRRARAGFRQTVGMPVVVSSWDEFLRIASECGELVS
jgi:hypothetical protein